MTLPYDEKDGWSYDDATTPTTVIFHGQACTDIDVDGGHDSLKLEQPCTGGTP